MARCDPLRSRSRPIAADFSRIVGTNASSGSANDRNYSPKHGGRALRPVQFQEHETKRRARTLADAINADTKIPSVAMPNGQAAFLLLLTMALAPLIRLSCVKLDIMALRQTITMSSLGILELPCPG